MRPDWDDVNARVRGLGTHLLDPKDVERLEHAGDLETLAGMLRLRGIAVPEGPGSPRPEHLELAIRRWAASLLATLARWAGPRSAALPFVFADLDRRSIRAMMRGALQRAPAPERLAGTIPTPTLPERALEELALGPTPARVAAHLLAWRHPFAAALESVATPSEPDLLSIEAALGAAVARESLAAARRAGDRDLLRLVSESIDLDNALTALALARESTDLRPRDVFIAGGDRLTIGAFEEAVATGEVGAAGRRLATALGDAPCVECLWRDGSVLVGLEEELLDCRLRELTRAARIDPLRAFTVLCFALTLRQQVAALQRAVWSVSLGAEPGRDEVPA